MNGSTSLDAKAVVPAVLNPIGMARTRWEEMGIDPDFAENQQAVVAAYERLGIRLDCTCTPYYLYQTRYGDHLAWSESSAVCYANSVIGARTNREGGPIRPCRGHHRKDALLWPAPRKNRVPQMVIDVHADTSKWTIADYGALGYHAGKLVGNRIPYFRGITPGADSLKAIGAAMAATGAVALYHVEGVTPEAQKNRYDLSGIEAVPVEQAEITRLVYGYPGRCRCSRLPALLPGRTGRDRPAPCRESRDKTALCLCCTGCDRQKRKNR